MKKFTVYAPLQNFGWIKWEIYLEANIKIRNINFPSEEEALRKLDFNPRFYKTVLIFNYYYKDDDNPGIFGAYNDLIKILSFLKLYIDRKIDNDRHFNIREIITQEENFSYKPPTGKYKGLDVRWKQFNERYKDYRLSFDWYYKALSGYLPPRETILYLTIALETTLLKSMVTELRYRFSLRGAHLLEDKPVEIKKAFEFLKLVYDYRSIVVHGNEQAFIKLMGRIKATSRFKKDTIAITERILRVLVEDKQRVLKVEDKILS